MWVDLLLLASYEDSKVLVGGKLVDVKRGQMIVSLSYLSKRWGKAKGTILKFLELLEADQMIDRCVDRKLTIITICKYESYQGCDEQSLTDVCTDDRPMTDQSLTEIKKLEEVKEINITNNHAHAREENVSWIESVERSFAERFKAQGCAMKIAKITGKKGDEIMKFLDIYMTKRELMDRGHKDFSQFIGLFQWSIENNKISIPAESKKKKVIEGADLLNIYG